MDLWVFAYGSLIWHPNFQYEEASPALLEGGHRSLCIHSIVYRGTPAAPGLVFGLDKGGRCEGLAFRVPAALAKDTRAYLLRRENVTNVYTVATMEVKLHGSSHYKANALCFLANRSHPQYAGDLPLEKQAFIVRRSAGRTGRNIDYVLNTAQHLRALGVHDLKLERLMAALGHSLVKDGFAARQA